MKPMKVVASMLFWFIVAVLVTAFLNVAHAAPVSNVGAVVVSNDQYDVITCSQSNDGLCASTGLGYDTPEQFAGKLGYKVIHRRYIVISGSSAFIVMEVSR
jgi:hypothetical protein